MNFVVKSNSFNLVTIWSSTSIKLKKALGNKTFKSWIQPLIPIELVTGCFVLLAPNKFIRDWLKEHCEEQILKFLKSVESQVIAIDIIFSDSSNNVSNKFNSKVDELKINQFSKKSNLFFNKYNKNNYNRITIKNINSVTSIKLDSSLIFNTFVVGRSNELAYAASIRLAESKVLINCNPLCLCGNTGLGKTHLLHAMISSIKAKNPDFKIIYLSGESFMYEFIRAIRFNNTIYFKEQLRSVDVFVIDDIQFISGKDSTQEEFFHTFNALIDQKNQVIMSSNKPPSKLDGMEESLKSRLGWGLVVDILPTTYELRLAILQSKQEMLKTSFPLKILEFLASKITSNIRELEGAMLKISAHSILINREVNIYMVQDILKDLLESKNNIVTVEEIQKKVSDYYNIKVTDMYSACRERSIVRPRQVAMYLTKKITNYSLPVIGKKYGGRDHTTVMHAVNKIELLCKKDMSLNQDVKKLFSFF